MLSAGTLYRMRRRRFFERKARPVAAYGDGPPDADSIHLMGQVDRLPWDVRNLIYEFGIVPVAAYYNDGLRGKDVRSALHEHRAGKQREQLATNYFLRIFPVLPKRKRKR